MEGRAPSPGSPCSVLVIHTEVLPLHKKRGIWVFRAGVPLKASVVEETTKSARKETGASGVRKDASAQQGPMTISKSLAYISSNPRFALTSAAIPKLQRGQMTLVYESLRPFPSECSLEKLASRCTGKEYESTYRKPIADADAPLFLRRSILYHLKRMEERRMVRERFD
jgi:hypothetical protein